MHFQELRQHLLLIQLLDCDNSRKPVRCHHLSFKVFPLTPKGVQSLRVELVFILQCFQGFTHLILAIPVADRGSMLLQVLYQVDSFSRVFLLLLWDAEGCR
jgi:hypothetical protein